MARNFTEDQIDAFKECFFFHARKGYLTTESELSIIIRSVGYAVTKDEVKKYFTKAGGADGRIDFVSFLEIMHEHSLVENSKKELKAALYAQDRDKKGYISAASLRHILTSMGEKLTQGEVDALLKEAGVQSSGQISINQFVDAVMTPTPDYGM